MATRAHLDGNARYHETLERVVIRVHKDGTDGFTKAQLEAAAQRDGQSVNAWVLDAIRDKI